MLKSYFFGIAIFFLLLISIVGFVALNYLKTTREGYKPLALEGPNIVRILPNLNDPVVMPIQSADLDRMANYYHGVVLPQMSDVHELRSLAQALKAKNNLLKIYAYTSPTISSIKTPDHILYLAQPEYFLVNQQGVKTTQTTSDQNYIMKIDNPDYRNQYLNYWEAVVRYPEIDGLFIDNISDCPPISQREQCDWNTLELVLGSSVRTWQEDLLTLVSELKQRVGDEEIIFASSYLASAIVPSNQDFLSQLDGAYINGFEKVIQGESEFKGLYNRLVSLMYSQEWRTKTFLIQAQLLQMEQKAKEFVYGSYLLFSGKNTSFYLTAASNDFSLNYEPEWQIKVQETINPPLQRLDGVYERSFPNALVYVNPTAVNKSIILDNPLLTNKSALIWNRIPVQSNEQISLAPQEAVLISLIEQPTPKKTASPTRSQILGDWSDNHSTMYSDFVNVNSLYERNSLKVGPQISYEFEVKNMDNFDDGLLINGLFPGTFALTKGKTYEFKVMIDDIGPTGSSLYIWIDWDGKGNTSPIREYYNHELKENSIFAPIQVPAYAQETAFVRIYAANQPNQVLEYNFNYPRGEIEDYPLKILD